MPQDIETTASRVEAHLSVCGHTAIDPGLEKIHKELQDSGLSTADQRKAMDKAIQSQELKNPNGLDSNLGTWAGQNFPRIDLNEDGKMSRTELLKGSRDNRNSPADQAMMQAILDRYTYFKKYGEGPNISRKDTGFFQDHAGAETAANNTSTPAMEETRAKISESLSEPNRLEKLFGSTDQLLAKLDTDEDGKVSAKELSDSKDKLSAKESEALGLAFTAITVRRAGTAAPISAQDILDHRTTINQVLKRKLKE